MNAPTKACPFCAEDILADAIKCKHCGSMLDSVPVGSAVYDYPPVEITAPLIVSCVWNILAAIGWAVTLPCVGLILAVPYVVLAWFEYTTHSKAATMEPRQLHERCLWLGIGQLIMGLGNFGVSLICGILLLVFRDKLLQYRETVSEPVEV